MSTEAIPQSDDDRPSPPLRYDEGHLYQPLNFSELSNKIMTTYEQRQKSYEMSRHIQAATQQIRDQLGSADTVVDVALQSLLETYQETALAPAIAQSRTPRDANLNYTVEDLLRLTSYQHFLSTGRVLPPVPWATDEEYLAGALMGLCSDLQSYGLGRATVRDVRSVQMAAHTVGACLEYLLSLDFRNGPLRRKYDGCKYSLKHLETLLYELAVTSSSNEAPPQRKRSIEAILPLPELVALRERFVFRDALRETLIKKCRDGQKMAKQSIFCLHRGDPPAAYQLIDQCGEFILSELVPMVQEEPPLRAGSFAGVLEEYVEAKLFYVWLHGRGDSIGDRIGQAQAEETAAAVEEKPTKQMKLDAPEDGFQMATGIVLLPQDFANDFIHLEPDEYIGGLCDLTGEIGRYAVQRGTARDVASVRQCLYTNANILSAMQSMERCSDGSPSGNQILKKMDAVRNSVQKIERMLYELSLSEAAGGRHVATAAEPPTATTHKDHPEEE